MKINQFLILFFLLIAAEMDAQIRPVNLYTFGSSSGAYTAIAGTSLTFTGNFLPYDDGNATVNVPGFHFYYGNMTTPQSNFTVNTNGWICAGTTTNSSLYNPISSGSVPQIISALGDDLDGNAGATVRYLLSGTAPNRVLTFQWANFKRYQAVGENLNFQIKLYETSNKIEFVYGTMTAVNNDVAQVGLAGISNTVFINRATTTNWGTSSAGGSNTSTMTLSSTVFPASGLTYSWLPSCTGAAPSAGTLTLSASSATCTQGFSLGMTSSGYSGVVNFQISTDGGLTWSNTGPTNNASAINNVTQTIYVTTTTRVRTAVSCGGTVVFSGQQIFTLTLGGAGFLTVSPAAPNINCGNSVTLTASGASSYVWNTGPVTPSIVVSPIVSTAYSVTGTAAGGCVETVSKTVNVSPLSNILITGGGNFCGETSATLTATGGNTYLWSNGASTAAINVSASNVYTVTATAANGCTGTSSVTVTIADWVHTGSITAADNDMTGRLTRDGNASICASSKVCPGIFTTSGIRDYDIYTYTNPNASSVCVTALINTPCSGNDVIFAAAYLNSFDPNNLCTNYLADIGGSPTSGSRTMSFIVPAFATFRVVVSANNTGATCADYTLYVDIPRVPLTITASGGNCQGSATLTCSNADSYLWSNGATTQSIQPSVSGTYAVTASYGNNGCTATATQSIVVNPLPTVAITGSGQFCGGTTATLTASGASTYTWSNGGSGASIPVTNSGIYIVTGTSSGCSATSSAQVIIADWVHDDSITAADNDMTGRLTRDGNASICASSKVCPGVFTTSGIRDYDIYTYTNPNASSVCVTALINTPCSGNDVLFAAAYLTSFDPNNLCTNYLADIGSSPTSGSRTMSFIVPAFATFRVVVSATNTGATCADYTLFVDIPRVPLTITASGGNCLGSATLTCSNADSYLWSNGATTQSIQPSVSGTYSVTASYGNNGCTATATQTIVVNPLPTVSVTGGGQFCGGTTVLLTASGASTYTWNTGASGSTLPVTTSEVYSVTGTSAAGCSATASTQVSIADWVNTGSITAGDNDIPGRLTRDGNASICASSKVCPGVFTTSGIRDYDIYTYTNPNASSVCVTALINTPCSGNDVLFAAAYLSSFDPNNLCTNYLADIGSSPTSGSRTMSFIVPAFATFRVVVSATNTGATCTDYTLFVDIPRVPLTITASGGNCLGSATLTCSNADSYLWSNGATTQSIQPSVSGTYSVTASYGNNGCTATATLTIVVNPLPTVSVTGGGQFCGGTTVLLTASGASTYTWNTGASGSTLPVTTSEVYSVTGTSAAGCSATASTQVSIADWVNTGSITAGDIDIPGRLTRDGNASICASSKLCPGVFTTSGIRDYDIYTYTNPSASSVCVTALINTPCSGNDVIFATAYLNSFDPNNLCSNYLADIGGSPTSGSRTMSFIVPAFATFRIVVSAVNTAATCANYTLFVDIPRVPLTITASGGSCGSGTTLTSSVAASYLWSTGATTQSIIATTAGTYTVTATYGNNGCTKTATSVVTVALPNANISPASVSICSGQTISLTASGGVSYLWSTGATTASISVSPASTTTYTVVVTNAAGCTASTTRTVTVNTSPTVGTSVTNATICSGTSTSITGTGALTYTWQPGALTGTTITVSPASSTTYTVTGTAANGCTKTATRLISVNTNPTISTSVTNATICAGNSTTISASGASTYSWNPGGLTGTSVIVSPASTTTYTVTGTAVNGCTNTATRLITVNTNPTISTSVTNATICSGSSTTLSASGANTYSWNPGGLTGTSVIVNPASTTTYTVTGTAANGCTITATRLITVNTNPTISTSVTNATICSGSSTTISASGANTYSWNPGGLTGTSVSVSPASTTTYTVTGTAANGCTNTATRLITVNTNPTISTSVTNATICAGNSTTISASGASTYSWNPGGLTGTSVIVNPASTTTYTVTGTAANGCTNTATRLITVNTNPTISTSVTNATICSGSSTTISASGANTYSWNPGGLTGTSVSVSPLSTTTYTVIGTNAQGCTNTATRTITVNARPTISTSATATSIACGGSSTITASGAVSYLWQPGGMTTAAVTVSPLSTTTYTVTGTAANGCTNTATRTITVTTPCGTTLNVKLYIEGYYIGAGLMTPALFNQGVAGASSTQTDSITVELRNTTAPYAVAATQKRILNTNGTSTGSFTVSGNYYIVIKHRNGLQTWSATPVTLAGGTTSYDFSNAITKAYGSNMASVGGGVFALYTGDVAVDENIDLADLGLIEIDISNFAFGYKETDINGDGNVDILDTPVTEENINNFIFSIHP